MYYFFKSIAAIRDTALLIPLLLFLTVVAGCGDQRVKSLVAEANQTNVEKLRTCYLLFGARHKYEGPKSEQELKDFLTTNDTIDKNLQLLGIGPNDVDDLFISQRDEQLLVVRWGLKLMPGSKTAVVSESSGSEGLRRIAFSDGTSQEVDEADYNKRFRNMFQSR